MRQDLTQTSSNFILVISECFFPLPVTKPISLLAWKVFPLMPMNPRLIFHKGCIEKNVIFRIKRTWRTQSFQASGLAVCTSDVNRESYTHYSVRRVDSLEKTDAGRDWEQKEKGMTEDEMAGWHHRLDGREFEWTPGDGDGQGGLACWDSWGRRVGHYWATELNWDVLGPDVVKLIHPFINFPFDFSSYGFIVHWWLLPRSIVSWGCCKTMICYFYHSFWI